MRPRQCVLMLVVAALPACTVTSLPPSARSEVAEAMQRYQAAARTAHPDSIAAFYTPTATLFEPGIRPVRTRDSIRAFIASFPGVQVQVATATPDTIEIYEGMALYWGSYFERLAFPGQPLSTQAGKFVAQWVRQDDGIWLLQRMFRVPLPPGDTTFAALQSRGAAVMGVDQYTSAHVFEDLPDGGRVILERPTAADSADIATIRAHMREIAAAFRAGDFTKPFQVHAQTVPGTAEMTARRDAISYVATDRPRGGEVRIRSSDPAAVAAIHAFLAFQRADHHAAGHAAP